jgi:sec-independent protein translocase protein TatA
MGVGFKELLVILVIVLVLFGAKRLRTIGPDLGGAIKSFRKALSDPEDEKVAEPSRPPEAESVVEKKDKV